MNPIDNETLQAFVDGELDAVVSAQIEATLAGDEALAERVRQARAVRTRLHGLFDPVLDEPVPERLAALLRPAAPEAGVAPAPSGTPAGHRASGGDRRRVFRRRFASGVALAASIAALAVGVWWHAGSTFERLQDGRPFAAGKLSHALDQALASEPDPAASIAIGLSFRSRDGHVCRTFVDRAGPGVAGLACREAAGWSLATVGPARPADGGELRQAASDLPPAIQAAVDARIRGDAFDAQQERAARANGWR